MISAFADSTLSLPVFNIGLNKQYRYWTPWGINFIEFSCQAAKARTAVFVPDVGQIEWKSAEHKELAELSLIDQIIPKQYHWLLGIPTMWRNNYCNHDQRLALFREWRKAMAADNTSRAAVLRTMLFWHGHLFWLQLGFPEY